jgi:hypothetical protein
MLAVINYPGRAWFVYCAFEKGDYEDKRAHRNLVLSVLQIPHPPALGQLVTFDLYYKDCFSMFHGTPFAVNSCYDTPCPLSPLSLLLMLIMYYNRGFPTEGLTTACFFQIERKVGGNRGSGPRFKNRKLLWSNKKKIRIILPLIL